MLLPLVLAGEITYIGLLASHPKFQQYVDAQEAKADRDESSAANQQTLDYIMKSLPRRSCAVSRRSATSAWSCGKSPWT